jgi:hypothetical protein
MKLGLFERHAEAFAALNATIETDFAKNENAALSL